MEPHPVALRLEVAAAADGQGRPSYGVVGDSGDVLHQLDQNTGKDFSSLQLSQNIEPRRRSTANMLVVGTYAKKLYGIRFS